MMVRNHTSFSQTPPAPPNSEDPGIAKRRRTQAEKRDANRRRILRAARRVFGKRGYHGARIDEIAGEADLSVGAIYYNFADKEALFLALLEERIEERISHFQGSPPSEPSAGGEGAVPLELEARDLTASLRENVEWRALFLEFVLHAARNPGFRRKFNALRARMREALSEEIERRFAAAGREAPLPPEQMAIAVSGLVNGLGLEELAEPGALPDRLLETILGLIVPAPGTER